jgi:hypothetical protein
MYYNFIEKNHLLCSIILFLAIFGLIILGNPSYLFNSDGSFRQFGIGYRNKTIFPIWLLAIILGILSYLYIVYFLHG